MSDIISLISKYVNEIIISSGRRGGDMGSLSDLISPFSPINQFLGGGGMSSVFNLFSQMSLIPAERVGGRNTSATNLIRTQSRPKSFQKLEVAQTAVIPFFSWVAFNQTGRKSIAIVFLFFYVKNCLPFVKFFLVASVKNLECM